MHNNGHRGPGSRPKAGTWLTPQQEAQALELALEWRRAWRADAAARRSNGAAPSNAAKRLPRTPEASRAAFAAGIARAEFGRFYWDAKKHRLAEVNHKPRRAK